MSKVLSYTQLTAHAEQRIRQHLADAARYRAAGDHRSEHHAQALANGVCDLWMSLALEHLDGLLRRTYTDDFARLVGLVSPDEALPSERDTAAADGRMTLHDAIVEVLTLAGHGLTASAIADEVNRLGHYHRADRALVPANQIAARVNVYAHLFVRQDELIDLPRQGGAPNPNGAR
ncbi:winged helix-turn-helix domain-containing protein (plasmid) [Burkholderia aenigmatica]|uniref:winged helix-turn-helix domain-containing protein n=1 Tax=Burkholderia aenigmatica TaxID=2015348 RepID=UPI001F22FC9F|nr:winged helix-turn-helix domain-containing protein [Burkholderia aenigmatica]UKD18067.1 winged helix-turn-helix domain-containing protein [Burkholderia aenigmatica]